MMSVAAPSWLLMLMLFSGAPLNLPLSLPPLPENAVIQRMAPEQCLWYLSLAGVDKANAKSKNKVEQLLAEDDVQQFVREATNQIKAAFAKAAPDDPIRKTLGEEGPKVIETLLTRPMCVYIGNVAAGANGPAVTGGIAVNLGDESAATKVSLEKIDLALATATGKKMDVDAAGWHALPLPPDAPPVQWGVQEKYLLIGIGKDEVQKLNDRRVNSKAAPEWLSKLRQQVPVDRPAMVQYINVQSAVALLQPALNEILPPELTRVLLEITGVQNARYYASVNGLDREGFLSRGLLAIDGEPHGMLSLISGQSLTAESLITIPADASFAVAARVDPDKAFEAFVTASAAIDPLAPVGIAESFKQLKLISGVHFQTDLLASLGDTWCVYNSPDDGGLVFTGLTVTATLRDHDKLVQVNDQLVGIFRQVMEQAARQGEGARTISDIEFRGQKIFFVNFLTAESPVAPAWCITDDHLVVSLFPQAIKSYLQRLGHDASADAAAGKKSLAEVPAVARLFSDGKHPTVISYQDTPSLFKLAYPVVQMMAQFGFSGLQSEGINLHIGMWPNARAIAPHLMPTVDIVEATKDGLRFESRGTIPLGIGTLPLVMIPFGIISTEVQNGPVAVKVAPAPGAAAQNSSENNLKQIALGVLNFESASKTLPAAFAADKDGKPLLSWRVAILPFIGEEDLASQFKLDEPWDSEKNKKLIERMPEVFKASGSQAAAEFKTVYLGVRGDKTVFPGAKPIKLRSISDGTAQTIMFVEATDDKAVVWTKPDDFEPDDKNPVAGLVGLRDGAFLAVFCDGHVEPIPADVDPDDLKALFTRNGDERVDASNLKRKPHQP